MKDVNLTVIVIGDDDLIGFEIVYLRSSTISRTAPRTRASTWSVLPWFSPSGERPSLFGNLFSVISVTSSRELKSDLQDMKPYASDFIPGEVLYSLLVYNIHLNNVKKL